MTPLNPYEAPKADAEPSDFEGVMRRDLRAIAMAQKVIMFCILGNFALIAMNVALHDTAAGTLVPMVALAVVAAEIWAVAVIATKLYGKAIAVFAALGMFIPCFSLVVLFMLNSAVTKRLRAAGVHVGLLGADISQLP